MRRASFPTVCLLLLASLVLSCARVPQTNPEPTPTVIQPTPTLTPSPTPPPTPTPETVGGAITLWHSWPETDLPALVQVINGFRAAYPTVLFDILYIPAQDLQARYQVEVQSGRGPNLLLGPAEWGPALYAAGLVSDLTPLVSAESLAGLNPAALETARLGSALVGAPYSIQGVILYRNKEIVTLPPDTLDDLILLAETSTQGEDIGAYLERSFFFSGAHLLGLGGKLMDNEGLPAFNDANGVAWIETLQKMEAAGPTNFFTDDDLEKFSAGRVGWIIDGTWNLRRLTAAIGPENLAIDPWPTAQDGRLAGFVMAEHLYLNPNAPAERRLTLRTFIDYLISLEAQTYLAEAGRIPAATQVKVADPITGPLLNQAITALEGGIAYPTGPEITYYNLNLDLALRAVFEDGVPPAQALDSAAAAVREALVQAGATATPGP